MSLLTEVYTTVMKLSRQSKTSKYDQAWFTRNKLKGILSILGGYQSGTSKLWETLKEKEPRVFDKSIKSIKERN